MLCFKKLNILLLQERSPATISPPINQSNNQSVNQSFNQSIKVKQIAIQSLKKVKKKL